MEVQAILKVAKKIKENNYLSTGRTTKVGKTPILKSSISMHLILLNGRKNSKVEPPKVLLLMVSFARIA